MNQTYDSKLKQKQEQLLLLQKFKTLFFVNTELQGRWMPVDEIVQYLNGIDDTSTSTRAFNAMITKKCPISNDYYLFPTGESLYSYSKEVKKKNGKKGQVRFYFVRTKEGPHPTTPSCWKEIYQRYVNDESQSTGNKKKRTRTRTPTTTTTTTTNNNNNTNSSSKN